MRAMLDLHKGHPTALQGAPVEIPAGIACSTTMYVATCQHCGECAMSWVPRILHMCPALRQASEPGDPSLTQKVANFAASAAKHLAAGMPRATEEQVAQRFAICQTCEHFDGKACRQCGCPIVRERQFASKLSWAGESCPVGQWGPVSS